MSLVAALEEASRREVETFVDGAQTLRFRTQISFSKKTDECREAVMIIRQARAENRVPGLGGKEEDECGDGAGLPMPISTR